MKAKSKTRVVISFKGSERLKLALERKAEVENTTVSRILNRAACRLVKLKEA